MMQFSRFAETIQIKSDKHVAGVTVTLKLSDCTGTIYFTDLQFQEGSRLTGYTVHSGKMLEKFRENGEAVPPAIITAWCEQRRPSFYSTWAKHPQDSTAIYIPYRIWRQAALSFHRAWAHTRRGFLIR